MTVFNVKLNRRQEIIKVEAVQKFPGFMVVIDEKDGKKRRHELSEVDFPSYEWEKIMPGALIPLTISESVTRWRVQAPKIKFQEYARNLVAETRKKIAGLFFIWICQYCGTSGYVDYEDGDDPQGIVERIAAAHVKTCKLGCKYNIRIFDHRGIEQEDSALFLSARMAVKTA